MEILNIKFPHWREILIAALSGAIIAVGDLLGLTDIAKQAVAIIGGTFVAGSTIAQSNPDKQGETFSRKLRGKKFGLTLLQLALTVFGAKFGIDFGEALGFLGGIMNLGIGVADARPRPRPILDAIGRIGGRDERPPSRPTETPPAPALPTAYEVALAEKGTKEFSGDRDNPRVVEYLSSVNSLSHQAQRNDETPWCSVFVHWCLAQAGIQGTNSAAARSWLNWGKEVTQPEKGDIVVFWRGKKDGWHGHVGFVEKVTAKNVYCLGGNQSDAVNIKPYAKSRVLGYRRAV